MKMFLVVLQITDWLETATFIAGTGFMLVTGGVIIAVGIFPPPSSNQRDVIDMICRVILVPMGLAVILSWISLARKNWPKPTMSAQWAKSIAHQLRFR